MRSLLLRSWLLVTCAAAILALAGCGEGNTLYSPTAPTGALSSGALSTDGTPDSFATAANITDEVVNALDKGKKDDKSKDDDDESEDEDQGEDRDDDDKDDEGEDDEDDDESDDEDKGQHDKGKGRNDKDKGQADKGKGQNDKDKGQNDKDKGQADKGKGENGNDKGGNSGDSVTACGRRDKAVGFVTAKGTDTLTVRGTSVKATTATRIHHGNRTLAFADIRVGNHVQAYGALSGTTLVACEIKVEDTRRNK